MRSKRIGVIGIPRHPESHVDRGFDALYGAVGKNTGNLMFTEAMFRLLDGEVERMVEVDTNKINENYDAVVIPAANWLNPKANFDALAEKIERLEIPVITIGIGLQAASTNLDCVVVSDSAQKLIRVLSRKAPFISVRGDFTRDWLNSIGISNIVTTGCPSLYMKISEQTPVKLLDRIAIQSTRYMVNKEFSEGSSLNRLLFGLAVRLEADMIYQSEIEEMRCIIYGSFRKDITPSASKALAACYGVSDLSELKAYLDKHGKVFLDLVKWSNHLRSLRGVVGTRLHGAILALNSGVPGLLLAHDSRTSELVSFASIPTAPVESVMGALKNSDYKYLFNSEMTESFRERRNKNSSRFVDFLKSNGLTPNYKMFIK